MPISQINALQARNLTTAELPATEPPANDREGDLQHDIASVRRGVEEACVFLASGRQVDLQTADGQDRIVIRDRNGEPIIAIEVDEDGPRLSLLRSKSERLRRVG